MTTFLIIIHVIVCIGLIAIVLIQRGRGAGLVESFSAVESMFGTRTNEFLTRTTTVLSTLFFITCLSLAALSVKQSKSLLSGLKAKKPIKQTAPVAAQAAPPPAQAAGTSTIPAEVERSGLPAGQAGIPPLDNGQRDNDTKVPVPAKTGV